MFTWTNKIICYNIICGFTRSCTTTDNWIIEWSVRRLVHAQCWLHMWRFQDHKNFKCMTPNKMCASHFFCNGDVPIRYIVNYVLTKIWNVWFAVLALYSYYSLALYSYYSLQHLTLPIMHNSFRQRTRLYDIKYMLANGFTSHFSSATYHRVNQMQGCKFFIIITIYNFVMFLLVPQCKAFLS